MPFVGVATTANSAELAARYRLAAGEGLIVTVVRGRQSGDLEVEIAAR